MEPSMIYSLIDLAQQKGTIFDCIFFHYFSHLYTQRIVKFHRSKQHFLLFDVAIRYWWCLLKITIDIEEKRREKMCSYYLTCVNVFGLKLKVILVRFVNRLFCLSFFRSCPYTRKHTCSRGFVCVCVFLFFLYNSFYHYSHLHETARITFASYFRIYIYRLNTFNHYALFCCSFHFCIIRLSRLLAPALIFLHYTFIIFSTFSQIWFAFFSFFLSLFRSFWSV